MQLRTHSEEEAAFFKDACAGDRLDRMTCRPLMDGRSLARDPRCEQWTYVSDEGAPIGWVTVFDFNARNRSAEFGFGLIPSVRGKGFAKPMLRAAFDRMFSDTTLNKLYCQTGAFNIASVRLLEGLGMRRDGILREHHELDGVFHDDYIYSLLRGDWEAASFRD